MSTITELPGPTCELRRLRRRKHAAVAPHLSASVVSFATAKSNASAATPQTRTKLRVLAIPRDYIWLGLWHATTVGMAYFDWEIAQGATGRWLVIWAVYLIASGLWFDSLNFRRTIELLASVIAIVTLAFFFPGLVVLVKTFVLVWLVRFVLEYFGCTD